MQQPLEIIPAIIPSSREDIYAHVAALDASAPEFQIDITDGIFVQNMSWPYERPGMLSHAACNPLVLQEGTVELDLMVKRPQDTLECWMALDPRRIVLHVESFENEGTALLEVIQQLHSHSVEVALALGNDTPLMALTPYTEEIDAIQCMGIASLGTQGEAFDDRVLARITALHQSHPSLAISVDGSVNTGTIGALRQAGAHRFVVGSAIFSKSNPAEAYRELCTLLHQQ